MASPAENYLNSFSPAEQQTIRASWAGNPNGMTDWFNNAVQAGAVGADGNPRDPNAGAGSAQAQQTGHTEGQSAGVGGSSGLKKGMTPTPGQLRQYAKENNWPEDFDRYNDATLQSWISSNWNPQTMMFTSEKKDPNGNSIPGNVYKPVDTPDGWTAWGQGAIPTDQANAQMAKWGQPPQSATSSAATPAGDPLQQQLVSLFQSHGGYFGDSGAPVFGQSLQGGGLIWSDNGNPFDSSTNATPAQPATNPALISATLNAFSPNAPSNQQSGGNAGAPATADTSGGWSSNPTSTTPSKPEISSQQPPSPYSQPVPMPTQNPATQAAQPPAPSTSSVGTSPLEAAVTRRYVNPNEWWMGGAGGPRQQVV